MVQCGACGEYRHALLSNPATVEEEFPFKTKAGFLSPTKQNINMRIEINERAIHLGFACLFQTKLHVLFGSSCVQGYIKTGFQRAVYTNMGLLFCILCSRI
jgi:hypothetical protein